MPRREVPVHHLRENAREWSPARCVFFDTETHSRPTPTGTVDTLRLWTARTVDRKPSSGGKDRTSVERGLTAATLADYLEWTANDNRSPWVYAHNLGFDLTVTALPRVLARRGWHVTSATMGGKSVNMRLAKDRRGMTLVDSWTWLPVALDEIGNSLGIDKLPLPTPDATEAEWFARCERDTDILTEAMIGLMDWWDRAKLGNWSVTGASTGWNAYRHNPNTPPVTIHPEPIIVAEDRRYVNGGRRATWLLGKQTAGPYVELDIEAAYPTVALNFPLPKHHRAPFASKPVDTWEVGSERWGLAARCLIRTTEPCVPVKWKGTTFYPVGEFWADLVGPDIAEARDNGRLLRIGPGRVHQLSYHMRPWARWVLATAKGQTPGAPPVAAIAAKHWSRSTIGKWASRAWVTTELGPAPDSGWSYSDAWDSTNQCRAAVQDIDGRRFIVSAGGDPENAYPAVFAWVESHVRVALNRVITVVGEGALLSANTDGMVAAAHLLCTPESGGSQIAPAGLRGSGRVTWALDAANATLGPLNLRQKGSSGTVTVLGPQHVQVGPQRRFSGIPSGAEVIAPETYQWHTWPGFASQLADGMHGEYRRDRRTVKVTGPFPSGWALDDGRVRPVEMTTDAAGRNVMMPFTSTRWAAIGERPAPVQRRELTPLI